MQKFIENSWSKKIVDFHAEKCTLYIDNQIKSRGLG